MWRLYLNLSDCVSNSSNSFRLIKCKLQKYETEADKLVSEHICKAFALVSAPWRESLFHKLRKFIAEINQSSRKAFKARKRLKVLLICIPVFCWDWGSLRSAISSALNTKSITLMLSETAGRFHVTTDSHAITSWMSVGLIQLKLHCDGILN